MKRPAKRFGTTSGQAAMLMVTMTSLLLIGILGFAVDGGQMYAQQQMAQAAADAAAQAGIMSIRNGTNATSTFTFGTGSTPIPSYVCTTADGRTPCVYARNNGFGGMASDTVTLSYPASVAGATLTSGSVPAFQVTVQRTLQTGLIRFIGGPATNAITAKAITGMTSAGSTNCIYILDPSSHKTFTASNGATVTMNGCAIVINSSASDAMDVSGSATVTASAIKIVGGIAITGSGSVSPAAVTGAASAADPLSALPALAAGSCTTHPTNYTPSPGTTMSPGTYCGGISIGNGGTYTFSSGDYIINGGGLTIGGGTTVNGSGVLFYLTGTNSSYGSVSMGNGATVTLSAPTSGTYTGILFFQDRSITSSQNVTINGGINVTMTGTLYFPTTNIVISNGASDTGYTGFVAQQISFSGGSDSVQYDPTGAKTGLYASGVALIQ